MKCIKFLNFIFSFFRKKSPETIKYEKTLRLENAICRRLRSVGVSCKETIYEYTRDYLVFLEWRDVNFEENINAVRKYLGSDKKALPAVMAMSFVKPGLLTKFCIDGKYESVYCGNDIISGMRNYIRESMWKCSSVEELTMRLELGGYFNA